MAVRDILLDTNAYAAFKRGLLDAVEVIAHAPRIGINSIVLGELLSGFAVGTREAENRRELEQFLASERVHQLVIDAETAAQYTGVYREPDAVVVPFRLTTCGSRPARCSTDSPCSVTMDTSMRSLACMLACAWTIFSSLRLLILPWLSHGALTTT